MLAAVAVWLSATASLPSYDTPCHIGQEYIDDFRFSTL